MKVKPKKMIPLNEEIKRRWKDIDLQLESSLVLVELLDTSAKDDVSFQHIEDCSSVKVRAATFTFLFL